MRTLERSSYLLIYTLIVPPPPPLLGRLENAKKSGKHWTKVDPPYLDKSSFREGSAAVVRYIAQTVYTPDMILYLCQMGGYTITVQNRVRYGPIFGLSRVDTGEYVEWAIYLGLLSIHIRYF